MMRLLFATLLAVTTLAYAQTDTPSATPAVASAPTDAVATQPPTAAPAATTETPTTASEPPVTPSWPGNTWPFDPAKTLRENVAAWAQHAGWRLLWLPVDPYEIDGKIDPLIGDFPAVLTTVADGSGLHICAQRRIRRVVVSDSPFICKDSQ